MRRRGEIFGTIDRTTVLLYLMLVVYGWLSIYSASAGDQSVWVFDLSQRYGKQLIWIGLALLLAFTILIIDAKFFSTFAYVFYFLMLIILVGVLLFGKTVAGSKSWFEIGNIALQPAEFAKFATALALAKYLSMRNIDLRNLKNKVVAVTILAAPAVLILLQNDTGSALVYFAFVLVLFREGLSGLIIVAGVLMAALFITTIIWGEIYVSAALVILTALGFLISRSLRKIRMPLIAILALSIVFVFSVNYGFQHILEPHQRVRIQIMLGLKKDIHGAGYNVNQAKIAIGSGGLTGKGFCKGMLTQNHFVPEQSTDFIFCTVGEERGFLGSAVLILLFLALLIRIIMLAERQRSAFSRIYGYGVASVLFFHFTINIAMTIGLAPVVGIPLPFFSYGGSSLWAFTILLFIFIKQDANRLNVL